MNTTLCNGYHLSLRLRILAAVAALLLPAAQSMAGTVYNDAVGDEAFPNPHLDIVSVEVQNNATDIMFTINLSGDPIASDWGKYLIGIDSVPAGDPSGNGWGRPISMPSGMDYWIGSWVDWGDGAEVYSWDGAVWNLDDGAYGADSTDIDNPVKTTSSVKLTTSLSSFGLSVGDSIVFDVFSSGGGGTDSAIDALSDPSATVANWDDPYSSSSSLTYTVVPEPVTLTMILAGLGTIVWWAYRRRS